MNHIYKICKEMNDFILLNQSLLSNYWWFTFCKLVKIYFNHVNNVDFIVKKDNKIKIFKLKIDNEIEVY